MGYLYQVSKTWYYGVHDGQRWIRRSARSRYKETAKTRMQQAELRLAQGKPLEEQPVQTFTAFAEEYLAHKEKLGYEIWRDRDAVGHLTPAFGARLLTEIDREAVERYVARRLSDKAKPGTVQKEITVLKAAYNQAIRWNRVEKNPAAKVTVKGASQPRERLLSEEELERLVRACREEPMTPEPKRLRRRIDRALFGDMVETALLTGMRKGELQALAERDCDFLREELRVRESKNGDPRTIPMHPRVKEILWARVRGVEERAVFPIGNLQRPFQEAVKRAGIRDLRFHDLRHCAASYLFMAGADPRTVMQILGHRDPRMTLRVYASVSQKHMREAVGRLRVPGLVTHGSQTPAAREVEKAK